MAPRQRKAAPREADAEILRRRNRALATLKEIAETLNQSGSETQAVASTLPLAISLLDLHTGWLFLLNGEGHFAVAGFHDLPPAMQFPGPAWRKACTCQTMARDGELRAAQVVECSRLGDASGERLGLAYHASVPLVADGKLLGILNVATSEWDAFSVQDLQILSSVGYQLAATITRTRLAEQATHLALAEERNRLAREVHDTLAQELAGIALQLEAADALLDSAPERARQRLRQALERTRESLSEARRSVLDLRSGPLERQDLPDALRELAERFADETGVAARVEAELGGLRLPASFEQALYRIAQEALANVRRHAHARAVGIVLRREAAGVLLSIEDDGQGFDTIAGGARSSGGFGLISMQERARLLGGTLSIHSGSGAGTRLEARLPPPSF